MSPSAEENPYQSPVESGDDADSRETTLRRASLAWQFPLIGSLLFVAMIFVNWLPFATSLSFLLILAMLGCWVGGVMMTVYAVLAAQRHKGTLRHGVQGMFCNALLTGVILLGVVATPTWSMNPSRPPPAYQPPPSHNGKAARPMTTPEPDNPFVSPTEAEETKITPEGVMRYARVGWIMPIVGGLWVGQWALSSGFEMNHPFLLVLVLICGVNLFIGLRCTIMAFGLRGLNPHVSSQIVWAVIGNLLLAVLFVVGVIGLFNMEWSLPPIFFDS